MFDGWLPAKRWFTTNKMFDVLCFSPWKVPQLLLCNVYDSVNNRFTHTCIPERSLNLLERMELSLRGSDTGQQGTWIWLEWYNKHQKTYKILGTPAHLSHYSLHTDSMVNHCFICITNHIDISIVLTLSANGECTEDRNTITFNAAINACEEGGAWEVALLAMGGLREGDRKSSGSYQDSRYDRSWVHCRWKCNIKRVADPVVTCCLWSVLIRIYHDTHALVYAYLMVSVWNARRVPTEPDETVEIWGLLSWTTSHIPTFPWPWLLGIPASTAVRHLMNHERTRNVSSELL